MVEVLAGELETPAIGERAMNVDEATTPRLQGERAGGAGERATCRARCAAAAAKFIPKRAKAREALPEFDDLRDRARDLKDHVLANLDLYLERYEAAVLASGGVVHWAETAEDARRIVLEICRKAGAKTVNKGKTMISEECGINDMLAENGITPVETDLGEYIIQLRGEIPTHIIAPAVHVTVRRGRGGVPRGAHAPAARPRPLASSMRC